MEKITRVLSSQCNLSRERIDTVWPTVLTTLLGSKPKGVKALLTLGHPSHSGFGSSKDKGSNLSLEPLFQAPSFLGSTQTLPFYRRDFVIWDSDICQGDSGTDLLRGVTTSQDKRNAMKGLWGYTRRTLSSLDRWGEGSAASQEEAK